MEDTFQSGISYAQRILIDYAIGLEAEFRCSALAYRFAAELVGKKGAAENRRISHGPSATCHLARPNEEHMKQIDLFAINSYGEPRR